MTVIVNAVSGSASDIQTAANTVFSEGGGTVKIPEGSPDWVPGSTWVKVTVPVGVDFEGAEPTLDSNGRPTNCPTKLVMPYDAADNVIFFEVTGAYAPKFKNIEFQGYRDQAPTTDGRYTAIKITNCTDFRIDHCYFNNVAGQCVQIFNSNGVIDHNKFVNDENVSVVAAYNDCTVWYGIAVNGDNSTWETNITSVLGHYTSRTVFIEDNYFEGWRHCVASNRSGHYVFRYNTESGNGYGSIDGHGREGAGTDLGTRAIECYENTFSNPVGWVSATMGVQLRGGGGIFYNNTVSDYGYPGTGNYDSFVTMIQYTTDAFPDQQVKDVWIWDNTLTPSGADLYDANWGGVASNPITLNTHFWLTAPSTFTYVPYTYPHPLIDDDEEEQEPEDPPYEPPPVSYFWVQSYTTTGGSVTPTGFNSIPVGQAFRATATPNTDYLFSYWSLDGVNVSSNSNYALYGEAQTMYTLRAYFIANPPTEPDDPTVPGGGQFTVNIGTGTGGSTDLTGEQTYSDGDTIAVVATASDNYRFSYWLLDNVAVQHGDTSFSYVGSAGNQYTLLPVFTPVATPYTIYPVSADNVALLTNSDMLKRIFKQSKQKPIEFSKVLKNLKKLKI